MEIYNWQQKDWPNFTFSLKGLEEDILRFAEKQGRVTGILDGLPDDTRLEAVIHTLLTEAIKTSEIEGEFPNRNDVLSSIRKNLGLHDGVKHIKDKSAVGLAELMVDVRNTYRDPLTEEKLFAWHRMLMRKRKNIQVGLWRTHKDAMQIISGSIGKEKVHFEAPPSSKLGKEMTKFLQWFNSTGPGNKHEIKNAPVRAAIAHLYFETIHPFEDGNGRIGRAIAEKALSQTLGRPVMVSLSRTIEANKKHYYKSLETAQRSNKITPWIAYFVETLLKAQTDAEQQIEFTLKKTKFFDRFRDQLNERQQAVVSRMLEENADGFEGGMNAKKYMSITKTSKATATRDMQQLLELGIFLQAGKGGRSTSYKMNL